MKITKEKLRSRVFTLNMVLDRPLVPFDGKPMIGHLGLEQVSVGSGYRLFELVSVTGGERNWTEVLTAKEMDAFITGVISGISLRNSHIAHMHIKQCLNERGLTPDTLLYSTENAELLAATLAK